MEFSVVDFEQSLNCDTRSEFEVWVLNWKGINNLRRIRTCNSFVGFLSCPQRALKNGTDAGHHLAYLLKGIDLIVGKDFHIENVVLIFLLPNCKIIPQRERKTAVECEL